MNIDIHAHFIPEEIIELIRKEPEKYQARIVTDSGGGEYIQHDQGYAYPLHKGFYDMRARLQDMDSRRIDMDFMSVSPTIFYYWTDAALAAKIARLCNDSAARIVQEHPDRLRAAATVPLQDVESSIRELERVVNRYDFRMVAVGTSIEERYLDDPEFLPFFKKAEELGVAILFHPYYVGNRFNLNSYYLTNLIGNPLDTTICIARLAFGGVLQQFPNLKLLFVHGGGYMPYQRGRLQHGHRVRNEPKTIIKGQSPDPYFDNVYYDTITHWGPALRYLVESHGSHKVLLGSDYPFDMADPDPVSAIEKIRLGQEDEKNVLGRNALSLLNIK